MKVELEVEEGTDGKLYFFVMNGLISSDRCLICICNKSTPTYVEYTDKATCAKRRAIA